MASHRAGVKEVVHRIFILFVVIARAPLSFQQILVILAIWPMLLWLHGIQRIPFGMIPIIHNLSYCPYVFIRAVKSIPPPSDATQIAAVLTKIALSTLRRAMASRELGT